MTIHPRLRAAAPSSRDWVQPTSAIGWPAKRLFGQGGRAIATAAHAEKTMPKERYDDGIFLHHVGVEQRKFIQTFGEHVIPAFARN
jgi:hypothetical protein